MRKWIWMTGLTLLLATAVQAAEPVPGGIWRDTDEASARNPQSPRDIVPAHYRVLALTRTALESTLLQAPTETTSAIAASPAILTLPMPDGSNARFHYVESSVMEAPLQLKFPEIRTYVGQGIDDPAATLRFDLTPAGFHAQILSWRGAVYIDPYQRGDDVHYISYNRADLAPREPLVCGVTGEKLSPALPKLMSESERLASGDQIRTFRVAIAATGEYTAFHGGTVPLGLAAITTMLNRVNGVYERELSTRMLLVANNNLLVYTNAGTDPYANTSGDLAANQSNVDTVIGNANYDIGHLVGTGGGGVAGLGVVCSNSQKARGLTGSSSPVGDPFAIDYVAHEMGHQFGGSHTFNGDVGSCGGGNRNAGTAYEPGSGITIQAYAGICGNVDLANNSLDHFHRASLDEMLGFIAGISTSCGTAVATGNTPPQVSAPARFTIPASTPFELIASGSDANGDTLTYNWEQFDLGPANSSPTLVDNGGPLFRGYAPSNSPRRTFPSLSFILNNQNVPPVTTGAFMTGELLPSTNRTMNFRVTARDNRAGGGGTQDVQTALTVVAGAGPFRVTAPNTAVSLAAATPQTISWDVANTASAPVGTARVRIRLSLDGGNTFPITLANNEANDGSATLPLYGATPTTQARIRVEAANNVYFDVSDTNFTITGNGPVQPLLRIASATVSGGNGLLEPNECNTLVVTLANDGLAAATGVSATLSTTSPNVTIAQANASFPTIPAGGSASASTPFQISTGAGLQCFQPVDLNLAVSYTGGGSPYAEAVSIPIGAVGSGNYNFASSTGATIPAGGALLAGSQSDDAIVNLTVPAGFSFQIYGTTVNGGDTLRVSTNGNLQITAGAGSSGWTNTILPSTGSGDGAGAFPVAPVLLPYWDDIDTSASAVTGGGIYTQVTGSPGSRKWIIEWRAEPVSSAGSAITVNFAIEISEGSSQFAYLYATTAGSTANGTSATIGVQANTTGAIYTQYGFNSSAVGAGVRLAAALSANVCAAGNGPCAGGDDLFKNGFE